MAAVDGPGHRRRLVERVLGVDVRFVFKQKFDDFEVPLIGGEGEGRGAVIGLGIHVHALGQERLDFFGVAFARRRQEFILGFLSRRRKAKKQNQEGRQALRCAHRGKPHFATA